MRGLNWSSRAFVARLIWAVQPQERRCRCRYLLGVPSISGRRVLRQERCARPGGHGGLHRLPDGRLGIAPVEEQERDPVIEAGEVLRAAEMAVRQSKRRTG